MKVILLERVEGRGVLGDVITVKDGFARNYLLPRHKALRANAANMKIFDAQRAEIEARNQKAKDAAGKAGEALDGSSYILIRQAGETGQLYGSVSTRDIAGMELPVDLPAGIIRLGEGGNGDRRDRGQQGQGDDGSGHV